MAKREIWHELLVNASPGQLYAAVAKTEGLSHWWTTGARGEAAVGKRIEFWFDDFCASIAEVTLLKPGELVRWHIAGGAASDWLDTDVEFKIFRDSDRTLLHFRHSNWKEDAKQFPHCSMGWAIFLAESERIRRNRKGTSVSLRHAGKHVDAAHPTFLKPRGALQVRAALWRFYETADRVKYSPCISMVIVSFIVSRVSSRASIRTLMGPRGPVHVGVRY